MVSRGRWGTVSLLAVGEGAKASRPALSPDGVAGDAFPRRASKELFKPSEPLSDSIYTIYSISATPYPTRELNPNWGAP